MSTLPNQSPPQMGQAPEGKKNNVILAHNEATGEHMTAPTVSGAVNIGGIARIELPDLETQKAGFYLPDEQAALLLTQYSRVYKTLISAAPVAPAPVRVPVTPPQSIGQQGQPPDNNTPPDNGADKQEGQGL